MLYPLAWVPGPLEWIFIGGIALLIFGKRLPEVARNMGKGVVEFKKGLKDIGDEVNDVTVRPLPPVVASDHKFDPYTGQPINAYKFDPHTGKPLDTNNANQV